MQKNVASQKIGAQMVSATDGSAFTSAVTVYVTGDAGTQAAGSVGSAACTHEGNGYHTYAPAQAETNYDLVAFTFIGTGAVPSTVQVFTDFPQTGDNYARLGAPAGASVSADVAAVKAQTAAIETDTQDLQTQIGTDGAGLTALPWNAAWDTEVQSEAQDAITASALATAVNLASLAGYVDTEVAAILAAVDTEVGAIKAKTDNLPASPAAVGSQMDLVNVPNATAVTAIQNGLATPTNITAGTITTVTNLTNAPTNGDLTATMKASVTTAATAATPIAASVAGAVGSVTAPVTAGTVSDKTGYALSSAGVQAIWDVLTSALTAAGSVGKRIADYLDATISSRGTSTYAGGDTSGTTTLLGRIIGTLATGTHNPQTGDGYARLGAPAGASVSADIASVKTDTGTTLPANLTLIDDYLDTEIAAIKAKTDNLPASPAAVNNIPTVAAIADGVWDEAMAGHSTPSTAGAILIDIITDTSTTIPLAIASIGTIPATSAIADAVWDEALSGHATAGTAGKKLTDLSNADLSGVATATALATLAGYVDTEVAAIKAVIDKLDTALVLDGAVYQLTANALELAPTSSGSGATAQEVWEYATRTVGVVGTVSANVVQIDGETTPVDNLVLALGTGGLVEKLNSMLEAAGLDYRFTVSALSQAPSGGGSGTGTYTDTIVDGANPLDGVRVQLSTDAAGSNRVYETYTNALGVFTMNPDPGTYYRWLDLAGIDFAQGVAVVVT